MLGMLVAYSAFLLSNVKGSRTFRDIGVYELLVYLWFSADAVEEILVCTNAVHACWIDILLLQIFVDILP